MKRRIKVIFLSLAIAAVLAVMALACIWSYANYKCSAAGMLYVYPNSTIYQVADSASRLVGDEFASRLTKVFRLISRGKQPRVGAYNIPYGESVINVAKKLKIGAQTPINFTFNNVRTIDELAQRIDNSLLMSKSEFIEATTSCNMFDSLNINVQQLPALFIPDTYNVYWTITPQNLIKKFCDNYNKFWNEKRKAQAADISLSHIEVCTLASIVEEETNKNDEKPIVAGLYINRLRKGMLLQADPTVKFALGDFTRKRILNADLNFDSPYNTYRHKGLPPGPIRIADKSSIDAVLNATRHNYLYMCAKEDFSGYHNFASDLTTHNNNASKYQRALSKLGIKK